MPSRLGRLIRKKRDEQALTLREFARRIEKSPSFGVMLEKDDEVPPVKEQTLRKIASVLEIDFDAIMAAAGKLPKNLKPRSELDVALYRKVRKLSKEDKKRLMEDL